MKRFLQRHADKIVAVLCGFDRLVFRGTLLRLVQPGGMFHFLNAAGVRLLDFKHYVQATSEGVKRAALREAVDLDRPVRYIQRPSVSKEEYARLLLREHPVQQGLICAFTAVEPCMSFEYHRSQDHAERGLRLRPRKCLHVYKYWLHPTWGFMSARVQTWFPFNVQVCLNGREWLARDFQRDDHTDFLRDDNCFTRLGDPALAQACMDRQLSTPWPAALDAVAAALNPLHAQVFEPRPMSYDWSAYQTEWATDVLFRDPRSLAEVYPALVAHATRHFQSPDVLRFLGRKAHGNFTGELTGSFKQRPEGVRVKHWLSGNSVKMYDKGGSVLRVETTIANPVDFKVFRPLQDDDGGRLDWRPLRKGVADLAGPRSRSGPTSATSTPSPPTTTARRCTVCSTPSHAPPLATDGASARSGPAIRTTSRSSRPSRAASSPRPVSATAICAGSSSPTPTASPKTRPAGSPPRSAGCSAYCGLTASSRRSRSPTVTASPPPANSSPPPSTPHATPRSSSCSRLSRESRRAAR